jgi:hypothetical protein
MYTALLAFLLLQYLVGTYTRMVNLVYLMNDSIWAILLGLIHNDYVLTHNIYLEMQYHRVKEHGST